MLDVSSLSQFEFFNNFQLVAGMSGTNRFISNVVILDHEGLVNDYSDFHEGDFVITNLLYAKDQPDLILETFKQLMDIGISSIAIKSIFFDNLSEEVIALADEKEVPIYFFSDIYIEDVSLNIVNYLRSSDKLNRFEQLIDSFCFSQNHESVIAKFLAECQIDDSHYISATYLTPKRNLDEMTFQRNLQQLIHKKRSFLYSNQLECIKYKKGFFLLYHEATVRQVKKSLKQWHAMIQDITGQSTNYYISIFDGVSPAFDLDIIIKHTLFTHQVLQKKNINTLSYSDLNGNNFYQAAATDRYLSNYIQSLCHQISIHDRAKSPELLHTLTSAVRNGFNINQTAKELYQHPNTIRYRLNKIKAILNCKDNFHFQTLAANIVMINSYYE